jgi:lipid-A-disaccharide synthase-like uncharacterized protein
MFENLLNWLSGHLNFLVLFGLLGQALFMMRFVAQWFSSEKAKRSVIPEIFWYFSLGGGMVLLIYAIIRNDPVFIIGQMTGLFIYLRNIVFIWRDRMKRRQTTHEQTFEELAVIAQDLQNRNKDGAPVSHAERRAAAEALQILKSGK